LRRTAAAKIERAWDRRAAGTVSIEGMSATTILKMIENESSFRRSSRSNPNFDECPESKPQAQVTRRNPLSCDKKMQMMFSISRDC